MGTAIICEEDTPSVAGGETVLTTSELPEIAAVPAASGAPDSVTCWTAPRSAPTPKDCRSMMIGVGSLGSKGTWHWIDIPVPAASSTCRQMLSASAIDGSVRAKTAATKQSRNRHIPMLLIFPPLILWLLPDPEPLFPGPRDRPAGRIFRDHLPEDRLAGNDPRPECRRQGDARVAGLGVPQLGEIGFHHLDRIRRR